MNIWARFLFQEWKKIRDHTGKGEIDILEIMIQNFMNRYNQADFETQGEFHYLVHSEKILK